MTETLTLRQLAESRGKDLISSDGIKLGNITEIVYDYLSGEPIWLGIASAEQPKFRTVLVPARSVANQDGLVRVAYSRDKIEGQPHADFGEGFDSQGEERHLYEYFGVELVHGGEVRVLRQGDPLPGLETVTND